MNGAVYISFFQGQLESVLEQVVQLAVQEISKTVGSSLNTLLLETAVKEQENRRLTLLLQSRENRGRGNANPADSGGSPVAGKNKAAAAAGDERADSGRTKPEQRQQLLHAPGGQGTEPGVPTDTRRLEHRGRVVDWNCCPSKVPTVDRVYSLCNMVWKMSRYMRECAQSPRRGAGVRVSVSGGVSGTRWRPHVTRALQTLLRPGGKGRSLQNPGQFTAVCFHMERLTASSSKEGFCDFLADSFEAISKFSLLLHRNDTILPQESVSAGLNMW